MFQMSKSTQHFKDAQSGAPPQHPTNETNAQHSEDARSALPPNPISTHIYKVKNIVCGWIFSILFNVCLTLLDPEWSGMVPGPLKHPEPLKTQVVCLFVCFCIHVFIIIIGYRIA